MENIWKTKSEGNKSLQVEEFNNMLYMPCHCLLVLSEVLLISYEKWQQTLHSVLETQTTFIYTHEHRAGAWCAPGHYQLAPFHSEGTARETCCGDTCTSPRVYIYSCMHDSVSNSRSRFIDLSSFKFLKMRETLNRSVYCLISKN